MGVQGAWTGNRLRRIATVGVAVLLTACQGEAGRPTESGASPSTVPSASAPGASEDVTATPGAAACRERLGDVPALATAITTAATPSLMVETLACLGVRVLGDGLGDAELEALLDGAQPVIPMSLVGDLAPSDDGLLLDLDSLVADLSGQGLMDEGGAPVTRASFDAAIVDVATAPEGAAARLLLELGRARVAARGEVARDTTWGEARLDAFQFLILGLGLTAGVDAPPTAGGAMHLAAFAAAPPRVASGTSTLPSLGQRFRSGSGVLWRSVRFSLCAAAHAARTSLRPDANPTDLWHRNGPGPSTAQIIFTLSRRAAPEGAWLLAGCRPPTRGQNLGMGQETIPGKSVTWSTDDAADEHGTLSGHQFTTNAGGSVEATYETVPETAPRADQIPPNEQTEPATFEIEVLDLVPGLPNTIAVKPTATKTVTIHWYEPANYKLTVDLTFVGTDDAFWSTVIVEGEWLLRPTGIVDTQDRGNYEGTGVLTFATNPLPGSCKFVYSGAGSFDAFGQALIPEPDSTAPLEMALALQIDQVAKDQVAATACPPGSGGIVSTGQVSLLALFVVANLQSQGLGTQLTWRPTPWVEQPGGAWEAPFGGTCGLQGICRVSGFARLEPVVP
ncbi:MAG TPA: hypothetical protein VFX65_06475 [Candidatus Limnocylindrales bacterium]|nr:hypothetical protein [Candidatus Limnocylindrales bacterium]